MIRRATNSVLAGFRALGASPLRSALSTLGVMIGVASLVAMLSFGDGLAEFVQSGDGPIADSTLITVTPSLTERVQHIPVPVRSALDLGWRDLDSLNEELGDHNQVVLARQRGVRLGQGAAQDLDATAFLVSATPGWPSVRGFELIAGRDLDQQDLDGARAVAVVTADALAFRGLPGDSSALGSAYDVGSRSFEVVGILKASEMFPGARIVVPITRDLAPELDPSPPTLYVRTSDAGRAFQIEQDLHEWLETSFPSAPYRLVRGGQGTDLTLQRIRVVQLLVAAVIGIAILVGGIGIMNVMLASVLERTREIGIRRAVGARRADILIQFLSEAVAVSAVGSGIGLLVGVAVAYGVAAAIRATTDAPLTASVSAPVVLTVAVIAVFVGVAFGLYPARAAAKLTPIEAIRRE